MTTTTITPDETTAQLIRAVESAALEPTTGQRLVSGFAPFFRDSKSVLDVSRLITVTDATQVSEIKASRENRLKLRAIRVAADKCRVSLKEDSKRLGDAIQGVYNLLLLDISAEEKRLQDAEDFAERAEAARKEKLKQERTAILAPYGLDLAGYDLAGMSDAGFANLLESTKLAVEARRLAAEKEATERAERERLAHEEAARIEAERAAKMKELEEARAKAESEAAEARRLAAIEAAKAKAEREEAERIQREKDKAAAAERERVAALQRAETARVKAESDAREKAEREAREAAEKEAKRLRDEEAARVAKDAAQRAEKEAAERRAAQAPDRDKLLAFADSVAALVVPAVSTPSVQPVRDEIAAKCQNFAKWIRAELAKLESAK